MTDTLLAGWLTKEIDQKALGDLFLQNINSEADYPKLEKPEVQVSR